MTATQGFLWAVLSWPCLLGASFLLECTDQDQVIHPYCLSISQEKLLDRVIQHAELIDRVAEESSSLFEDIFVPYQLRLQRNQAAYPCITKAIPIPNSIGEVQQMSDKWLLHSVLMLVQSWIEPLVYLQTTLDHYDGAPEMLLNKTKWVSEKLISLEQGVVVLIKKMLNEGLLTTSYSEQGLFQYDRQTDMVESVMRDYILISCFKKDSHKIATFLKILKCRQNDNYNCA
ncbi:somatolactin alpha [Syngnathoides biaculeatus]|uniref:somatolactin alpha n=1 Tax=Syngnathoides biaculeatus TaxID=300417 RepID=UPI002ADD454E|nr:somatolactin alpha [Syngnathoides biaculeatus]